MFHVSLVRFTHESGSLRSRKVVRCAHEKWLAALTKVVRVAHENYVEDHTCAFGTIYMLVLGIIE
jgi:hypothetical protein